MKKKILKNLKRNFNNIKVIKSQRWPMPVSVSKKKSLLNKLQKKKIISFDSKYGLLTYKTNIYCAG